MNFLIVDDSPAVQVIVRRALEREGFADAEFRTASTGAEALDIIARWAPDLIVTDWHMPGMSGLELMQLLRQTHTKRHLIGFVTTESVPERLDEARRNGAAFVVGKPFTDSQLGEAVRGALEMHEAEARKAKASGLTEEDSSEAFGVASPEAIQRVLQQALNMRVELKAQTNVNFSALPQPSFLAFFGVGQSTAIRAFCLLDRFAYQAFKHSVGSDGKNGDEADVAAVTAMFSEAAGTYFQASAGETVTLLRAQSLAQLTPKLLDLLSKPLGRHCFQMIADGKSLGLITFIAR